MIVPLLIAAIALPANCVSHAFAQGACDTSETAEAEDATLERELVVDLELEDTPLFDALLQILFTPSSFRIVGRDDIRITATLRATNLEDAIEQLCEQTGVLAVKRGVSWTVYSVGAEQELEAQGIRHITYLFRCRNARAADIADIIEGRDPRGFPQPRPLLSEQDQYAAVPPPLPEVPSQPYTGIHTDMMADDTPGRGIRLPLGRVQYELVPHLNAILVKGPLAEVRESVDFLRVVDRPMPLVLIELLIVQYFHGDQFSWRFDLVDGQIARGHAPRVNQPPELIGTSLYDAEQGTPPGPGVYPFGPRPWGVNVEQVGLSAAAGGGPLAYSAVGSLTSSFKHNVQWLVSKNQARVVTNPHIAVMSGHEGTIELDEIFNFTTTTVFPTAGASTTGQREELNSKTVFTVTPTVVSPDSIHMAINSELAVFVQSIAGLISELPDQRKNKISTSVMLGESETLIIGGLVKEEATDDKDKVPFFSKLPIVGPLFRGRDNQRQFTETVVYITPHISQPQGFEDAYFKQIFQQMERLQDRGQDLIEQRRADAMRACQFEKINEIAAREQKKALRQSRWIGEPCPEQQATSDDQQQQDAGQDQQDAADEQDAGTSNGEEEGALPQPQQQPVVPAEAMRQPPRLTSPQINNPWLGTRTSATTTRYNLQTAQRPPRFAPHSRGTRQTPYFVPNNATIELRRADQPRIAP